MDGKYNLSERLIDFAVVILKISAKFPKTIAANHIAGQIVRSGTAPALHYGEAQAAESSKDFIHKMKVALKELRETFNGLRISRKMLWLPDEEFVWAIDENNQLISIFYKSIETAKKNNANKNKTRNPASKKYDNQNGENILSDQQ